MKTNCKDCQFLIAHNGLDTSPPEFRVVYDCELGKLRQYKQHNVKITTDDNRNVIMDIICSFKRPHSWVRPPGKVGVDGIEQLIIEENGFPYSCFIYENDTIDIEKAVDQILTLNHLPKYLYIVFKYMHQDVQLMQRIIAKIEPYKIKYKLSINMDQDTDNFYSSILAFFLNLQSPFVAIFTNNYDIPPNITTELSYKIQKELLSFPYANTPNNEFMIFPTSILLEYKEIDGANFIENIIKTQCQNYKFQ